MKQDGFEQLLQRADRTANIPAVSSDGLAHRARQIVRRQKRIRLMLGCGTTLAIVLLSIGSTMNKWNQPKARSSTIAKTTQPTISKEDVSQQIQKLCDEADRLALMAKQFHSATAASHAAAPKPSSQTSRKSRKPVVIPIRFVIEQEAEITARVMVEQARRWLTNPERREEGIRTYHRTIDLFPTTTAAKTARFRLTQLEKQSGATT
ncbi:MAG: hypothetical protein GXP29_02330 [Planctomycetes bacterium]|nr:hypothetical protein [Planctomycetota bacterium]